jgi:enamine deaminase RidA (YjgF/YER057c/UK114 family)
MPTVDPNNPRRVMYSTGTRYEFQFGYSRAVRHGSIVKVSGTAGLNEKDQVVSEHVVDQARAAIARIREALEDLGCTLEDVIFTRIFVKDVRDMADVAVAHAEVFREIRPATTIVKVADFIDPKILVEIEAEAVYAGDKK